MKLYSVTLRTELYVLANSLLDAEQTAEGLTDDANRRLPGDAILTANAYKTPNQSKEMKALAVNKGGGVDG